MVDRAGVKGNDGIGKRAAAKIAFIRDQVQTLDLFEDTALTQAIARLQGVASTPEAMGAAAKELKLFLNRQIDSLDLDVPRARTVLDAAPVPELGTRSKRAALAAGEAPDLALPKKRALKEEVPA